MAEAMGGDFRTGALAAGANEAVVDFLADKLLPVGVDRNSLEYQQGVSKLLAASQLVGVLTAAVTGGDASAAAAVTANATQYNNLDHPSAERLLKELQGCRATQGCTAENIREIVGQYEKLSTQRSMAINACGNRACVEDIQKSAVSLETPVAKDLMDFLRRNISYDMAGLLTGNPGLIAVPSQGVDPWGAMFTSDKQMAFAKYVKEGWLTPDETAGIDQWVKDTSWLDVQAGKQLSLQDRANMMTGLTSAAAMALIGRNPAGAGGVGAKETAAISSEAASVNAQAALRAKLSGLQKAQENAAVTKTLPDGRIRYYTQEVPARTEGVTRGASFATEYNPTTGSTRQWMESYDHSRNIIRVHPKSINGQPVSAQHYPPTGAELESWK